MIAASPILGDLGGAAIDEPVSYAAALGGAQAPAPVWRERAPALAAAALVHILAGLALVYLFTAHASTPGGHSVAVTLVSSMGGTAAATSATAAPASAATALASLQARLATLQPPTTPSPAPSPNSGRAAAASSLSEILGEAQPQRGATGASAAKSSAGAGAADGPDPYAHASLSAAGAQLASSRSLRDQVARCWRGSAGSAPVTLSLTLDERGQVVGAPSATGQARAAAQAVAAAQACAPYVVAARGPTTYQIELR